jgi:hypothetical protein
MNDMFLWFWVGVSIAAALEVFAAQLLLLDRTEGGPST